MAFNRIQELRKAAGITQEQLSKYININRATLSRYESGDIDPPTSQLWRIAEVLNVSVSDLLGQDSRKKQSTPWWFTLDQKLAAVGCSVGFYEEDACIWINYPDGTLEVTNEELQELNESTDSYLRFKLQELQKKHKERFRPQPPQKEE